MVSQLSSGSAPSSQPALPLFPADHYRRPHLWDLPRVDQALMRVLDRHSAVLGGMLVTLGSACWDVVECLGATLGEGPRHAYIV